MAEPGGRGSLRLGAVLALAVVALFELQALAHGVRSQHRLRAQVRELAEWRVAASRPELEAVLSRGQEAWDEAARLALERGLAAEVEVMSRDGRVVFSRPHGPPVAHLPSVLEAQRLQAGGALTVLARNGAQLRALTYLPLPGTGPAAWMRLASRAPELERQAREWQAVLLGHVAALVALVLATALVLWSAAVAPAPTGGALSAYEEAMGRLRDRGQELSERHEEEVLRMEARMREQEAMARAGELTAGIVHEVRNGLGTIVGYARLLEGGQDPRAASQAILDECRTLETVVRRFTDFVKLDKLQLGETDIRALATRVLARENRAHDEVSTRILGLDAPLVVEADEELLERALENLVRNALQAAAVGGRHVDLRAERTADGVLLEIADDGPGFAPDRPAEVRPFYTTRAGGLGLGLPLARKIVLLHGGELVLAARAPSGVSVTVRLPGRPPGGTRPRL